MTRLLLLLPLALVGCAAPLTGNQAADCLNARNAAIAAQNGVTTITTALSVAVAAHRPQSQVDALQGALAAAQSNLDAANARAVTLCTPAVTIIPATPTP